MACSVVIFAFKNCLVDSVSIFKKPHHSFNQVRCSSVVDSGFEPCMVKPNTTNMSFVASSLSRHHIRRKGKDSWVQTKQTSYKEKGQRQLGSD